MKSYTFIKEEESWFIYLPEYIELGGKKEDLAMIEGADTMLDIIAKGGDQVVLSLDKEYFGNSDPLILIEVCPAEMGGGFYIMPSFQGKEVNHLMWLCDVIKFVFGDIPQRIYVRRESNR